MTGLKHAFEHFGAVPKNIRWSVSGRSPDGATVAQLLWVQRFEWKANPISYSHFGWHQLGDPGEPSLRERFENLKWAQDKCGGLFRVILAVPVDPNDITRGILRAFPHDRLLMKIDELKPETGEFSAHNIGT